MYKPEFVLGNRCLRLAGEIEAAREVIPLLNLSTEWQMKLKDQATVAAIEFGLKVDGIRVGSALVTKILADDPNRDESAEIVASRVGLGKDKWAVQGVMNYMWARKYVEQLVALGGEVGSEMVVKTLCRLQGMLTEKLLPADMLGIFRTTEVRENWAREWWKQPVSIEVVYQMEDLVSWWKSDEARRTYVPVAVAILVYELLRIRPMVEANGRSVLLLSWYLLSLGGYAAGGWYALEEGINWSMMSQGDLSLWIEDFLAGIAKKMSELKETCKRLTGSEVEVKVDNNWGNNFNQRQVVLMELFKLKKRVTMKQAREALPGLSDDTIWRDMKVLIKKRLVKKAGTTRATVYILRSGG